MRQMQLKKYLIKEAKDMVTTTWCINRKNACDWLKTTFPESFGKSLPLKVGIFEDIKAYTAEDKPALIWCRRALRLHTARFSYLRKLKDGAERVDLSGKPCGLAAKETQKVEAKIKITNNEVDKIEDGFKNRPILRLKKKKPLESA